MKRFIVLWSILIAVSCNKSELANDLSKNDKLKQGLEERAFLSCPIIISLRTACAIVNNGNYGSQVNFNLISNAWEVEIQNYNGEVLGRIFNGKSQITLSNVTYYLNQPEIVLVPRFEFVQDYNFDNPTNTRDFPYVTVKLETSNDVGYAYLPTSKSGFGSWLGGFKSFNYNSTCATADDVSSISLPLCAEWAIN